MNIGNINIDANDKSIEVAIHTKSPSNFLFIDANLNLVPFDKWVYKDNPLKYSAKVRDFIFNSMINQKLEKILFYGADVFFKDNIKDMISFCKDFHEVPELQEKPITACTGFIYEDLAKDKNKNVDVLLDQIDYLYDGNHKLIDVGKKQLESLF